MTLYICMSIAGSIPVILCWFLWVLQKQSYNFYLGKKLLVIGMIFYLIPFQTIKFKLPERAVSALSFLENDSVEGTFYNSVAVKSILTPGDSVWIPKWLSVLLAAWLCYVIMFAVYQVIKYRIDIRRLLTRSEKVTVEVNGKTVELLLNKRIHTPYTVGFIKQSIIVPEGGLQHPCFPMFYKHEEQHRINHDSLMKLICIIIICIHWINPIAILLLFLYDVTAEYICDAQAVKDCTAEEKKRYVELLIELSAADEPLSTIWRSNLSGLGKLIKRRINYMMKEKKTGRLRKGIAVAVTAVSVFASASTILAYEPLLSTGANATEFIDDSSFAAFSDRNSSDSYDFSASNYIFTYEDGRQVTILNGDSMYALCNHTMKKGYLTVHKPNNSGGCTVYEYNAERCTKCGYIEASTLYATYTYTVCLHK